MSSLPFEQINSDLLSFIEQSPTAFHAVHNIRLRLQQEGYRELTESDIWQLVPGGKYFTVRNESSVIAFRLPLKSAAGFMIAASHSDSPSFKIKSNPEMKGPGAYVRLNVEKYGGMLMAPWFDRPLSVAGRVIVRSKAQSGDSLFQTKLIDIDRDLLMIPSLAIHMNREANDGFHYNPQVDLLPIYGDESSMGSFSDLIAEAAGVSKEDIIADDLFLYPRTKGSIWGAHQEFLSAPRLDDLQCSFADLAGFLASEKTANSSHIPVLAIFDNEEVGSGTKQGADSTFLFDTLTRIGDALSMTKQELSRAVACSFMLSADNAHALHPAHPEKADPVNRPAMNKGIVIKYHAGQKYTTDAVSAALFKEICRMAQVPYQEFTNRSDLNGGSTLGNISNAHVSLNTVDIGLPQLAMHSPYETAGARDTAYLVEAVSHFYTLGLFDLGRGMYSLQT